MPTFDELNEISAIKFEAGRIKFLSDVFVAVAVVAAQVLTGRPSTCDISAGTACDTTVTYMYDDKTLLAT